jgi:PAS domain S-box-containing protein
MERFEQYIEFAPDAIVGVAGDGTIALANAQSVKVFGYTRGELIGQPVEMLVPERFRAMHDGHRGDFVTDPRTRAMGTGLELFGRRADGSEFPAEISLASIETEVGIIATAAIRDVSERLRAERKFEQFIEFAPDAIVGIEADGRIALVNGQTEKLFGYARDDLIGERVEKLIPGRFHERHEGHRSAYFGDPRTRPMGAGLELFGTRSDGTEFPCEISLSSIETERGPMATASIRDISDRVAAEQEREQLAAELAEQRRADGERERSVLQDEVNQLRRLESVGQLAGGVAHDFNNILGVVLPSSRRSSTRAPRRSRTSRRSAAPPSAAPRLPASC